MNNILHVCFFQILGFKCIYCMKDFEKRQNLLNHVHKKKQCREKHIPYTNCNYYNRDKRPIKCEFSGCNGSYTTKRNREIHYNNNHGVQKSNPEIKRPDLGPVCKYRPNRKKTFQSKTINGKNFHHLPCFSF